MPEFLIYTAVTIDLLIMSFFGLTSLYFLFFAISSMAYRETTTRIPESLKYKVHILIPAYKEDQVIVETTVSAMKHRSILSDLKVLVIADSMEDHSIEQITETGADVLEVSFKNSTKARALRQALPTLPEDTDYVVILDADNLMAPGFVDRLLIRAEESYFVVQGHRTARNQDTWLALLDGISEEVNNTIFRRGHRAIGLSAALIGSGYLIDAGILRELIPEINSIGEDKELELELLNRKITIAYAQDAIVYDEKIRQPEAFVNQRRRWLTAQFLMPRRHLGTAILSLFKAGNLDYLDKTFQMMLPPRIISLGTSLLMVILHGMALFFPGRPFLGTFALLWAAILLVTGLAVTLSIPKDILKNCSLSLLASLPRAFQLMIRALGIKKGSAQQFRHTRHGVK